MRPIPLTKSELLAHLDAIRAGVESGDTLEGSITFGLPYDGDPDGADFMVRGSYRIGNLMGQGGVRMVGALSQDTEAEPE